MQRYHQLVANSEERPPIHIIKGDNRQSQGKAPTVSIKEKSASLSRLFPPPFTRPPAPSRDLVFLTIQTFAGGAALGWSWMHEDGVGKL